MRERPSAHRRLRTLVGLALGCALAIAIFATQDFHSILSAASLVGSGFALVVGWRIVSLGLIALGWRRLFMAAERPPFLSVLLARWVGEAVNSLLPVAQVGGEIVRGRIIMLAGPFPLLAVVAAIIVDMTLNLGGQVALALTGAWHVWHTIGGNTLQLAATCLVALLPLVLLALAQHPALLERAQRGFGWLASSHRGPESLAGLSAMVGAIYGRFADLAAATAFHGLAAFGRAFETWIVLRLMGTPVGVMDAIMIEGLAAALRTAAFVLPAGLGIQEGALLVLCSWIGVSPAHALALALVKRGREVAIGVSGLLLWLVLERRARTR